MPFTNYMKHKMVQGTLAHLHSIVVTHLLVPDHSFRDFAALLNCQRQGDDSYCSGHHRQSKVHNEMTRNEQCR